MTAQRIRARFRKGQRVRYISHLDVLRYWERALRRAELPLAYSHGFTPHPRLAFASPLPLGFLGEAEILEATLTERVPVAEFLERIECQSTEDLAVIDAREVPVTGAAPQALLRWADYRVDLPDFSLADAEAAVRDFLVLESLPWREERGDRVREYDLRAAVVSLAVSARDGGSRLSMRLRADAEMTGRPEQVIAAMAPGHESAVYVRTGLILDEPSPAIDAWRRRGRFE